MQFALEVGDVKGTKWLMGGLNSLICVESRRVLRDDTGGALGIPDGTRGSAFVFPKLWQEGRAYMFGKRFTDT